MDTKIKSTIWEDEDFASLSDGGKVLFFWLLTTQGVNNIGYLEVSNRALRADTGRDSKSLVEHLKGLPRAYHFDEWNGKLRVWVRWFVKHQWTEGALNPASLLFKNVRGHFMALPESHRAAFADSYPALSSLFQASSVYEGACKSLVRDKNSTAQSRTDQNRSGKGSAEGEPAPHIPSEEEFCEAFMVDGIPGEYLRRQFTWFQSSPKRWLDRGDLVDWKFIVRSRWKSDRASWTSSPTGSAEGGSAAEKKNSAGRGQSAAQQIYELDKEIQRLEADIEQKHELNQPWPKEWDARLKDLKKKRAGLKGD